MPLSPLDIKKKQFRRVLRGYDEAEVTAFLEEASAELDRTLAGARDSQQRLAELEARLAQYTQLENNIQQALVQAQNAAAKTVESARREAELLLRESEMSAQKLRDEAGREVESTLASMRKESVKLSDEINSLRSMRTNLISRIKSFMASQVQALNTFDSDEQRGTASEETPDFLNMPIDDILKSLE